MRLKCRDCNKTQETGYYCDKCGEILTLCKDIRVNINLDNAEKLQELSGVGPILAEEIIQNRRFYNIYDLAVINGISKDMIESWKQEIVL